MTMKRKKITIKDLRKHVINTKKVEGGKIHTISTPNAGNIEIAEGNKHSKGGVNYIKTSDGVTHEIEGNEVVLDTEKGPYVVSDYMNTDGTKNYSKNKTSYADLVKHLALAGASKQDLERVAMETEIANGNDPNNPTSLIKDTNIMKQPDVEQYQQTNIITNKNHPVTPPTVEQSEASAGNIKEGNLFNHGRFDRPEVWESMRNEWLGRLEYYTNSNIPPRSVKGVGTDPLKLFLDKKLQKNESLPVEDKMLKEYKYKGGGLLKRYQEPETNPVVIESGDIIDQSTNSTGTDTTIESDFLYQYDENLTPIEAIDSDNTYGDYSMKDWTPETDETPNVQPTQEDFHSKGFNNVQEWRDWVNTQPGFEGYDWGSLDYWGPKHDEAWKGMPSPPDAQRTVSVAVDDNSGEGEDVVEGEDVKEDGKPINWKKWGALGLGGLAAFGAYKAISGQMGKADEMLEEAKKENPNNIGKQQLGRVDLQRISHRSQIVDSLMRGQSMDNSVEAMNVPEAAKYLLKERNTITTQREVNKIKEAENNINVGISVKEGGLNAQLSMKQADLNTKVDVANQLESRDIRDLKYAAWDRQVAGRQQLISDLMGLGAQGIEAYATLKSKSAPITKGQS